MRYENDSENPIEATFKYAQESSTVYNFKITVGDKTLVAKCQEKKEALNTYDDGISSGYGGFLLEQGKHDDMFTLSIGY
jgi:Ca-activated chloride channel family protein